MISSRIIGLSFLPQTGLTSIDRVGINNPLNRYKLPTKFMINLASKQSQITADNLCGRLSFQSRLFHIGHLHDIKSRIETYPGISRVLEDPVINNGITTTRYLGFTLRSGNKPEFTVTTVTNEAGELHSADGPALSMSLRSSDIHPIGEELQFIAQTVEIYYKNNKVHRDNGPALIAFKTSFLATAPPSQQKPNPDNLTHDDNIISMYCQNGLLHRTDGPAIIMKSKRRIYEFCYNRGMLNDIETQPAVKIEIEPPNMLEDVVDQLTMSCINGAYRDGLSVQSNRITTDDKDQQTIVPALHVYTKDNVIHRTDGPAIITKLTDRYYLNHYRFCDMAEYCSALDNTAISMAVQLEFDADRAMPFASGD